MNYVLILASILISLSALAETHVYDDGNHLNAELMDESEAKTLYDGLNVEPLQSRSGTAKFFYSTDQKASIYCSKGSIPGGVIYSCTLAISYDSEPSTTIVFKKDGFLHACMDEEIDAKPLYEALNVGKQEGRSGASHYFYTDDRKASVYCSQGTIPTPFFSCEIRIQSP